jgi:acetoin utilization protein AcuA
MFINTTKGQVDFASNLTSDHLVNLTLAHEFRNDSLYKSIFTKKESLQRVLGKGGKVALALLDMKTIVGFASLDFPNSGNRWGSIGGKTVMELNAVEVIPELRKYRIAQYLLNQLMADSELEQKILYLVSYQWIWDLDQTNLSPHAYRNLLIKLFSGVGFKESVTNEPNVCLNKDNIFMVRFGKNVSTALREAFKWSSFGLSFD